MFQRCVSSILSISLEMLSCHRALPHTSLLRLLEHTSWEKWLSICVLGEGGGEYNSRVV